MEHLLFLGPKWFTWNNLFKTSNSLKIGIVPIFQMRKVKQD